MPVARKIPDVNNEEFELGVSFSYEGLNKGSYEEDEAESRLSLPQRLQNFRRKQSIFKMYVGKICEQSSRETYRRKTLFDAPSVTDPYARGQANASKSDAIN